MAANGTGWETVDVPRLTNTAKETTSLTFLAYGSPDPLWGGGSGLTNSRSNAAHCDRFWLRTNRFAADQSLVEHGVIAGCHRSSI